MNENEKTKIELIKPKPKAEICNVCGSDGYTDRQQYQNRGLLINPGYTSRLMCHLCYKRIGWSVMAGLRRLGVFGTIDEPRSDLRVWTDDECVQYLLDTIIRLAREKNLKLHIKLGDISA